MATTAPVRGAPQLISRVPYLPGLDGMRALAVMAVIVYHANSSWLHGGFLGVEVFFVISGYLITLLLVSEHERSHRVALGQFWLRRARRLLPALTTMMVLLMVWVALFERDELGQLRGDLLAGIFYVSNWYQIYVEAGYTAVNEFAPLRHLWSLAVEEQYYLVWPLVMVAVLRRGRANLPRAGAWMFAAAVLIALVTAVIVPTGPIGTCTSTPDAYWQLGEHCISKVELLYLGTFSRATGLLLGSAFALWWRPVAVMRGPARHLGRQMDLVGLVGLVVLGVLAWQLTILEVGGEEGITADLWLFRGGLFLTGIASLMVVAAVTHRRAYAGRILGNPLFLWVGTRSYGLYLYHWPIFQIVRNEAGVPLNLLEFTLCMIATVILTELSYRLIETPIRQGRLWAWFRGLRVHTPGSAERRRRVLASFALCAVLPIFAVVSVATAELEQNEVAASLEEGADAVIDVTDLLSPTTLPSTDGSSSTLPDPDSTVPGEGPATQPTAAPAETVAPTTVPPTTTTLPIAPIDVFALGDSVMLGAAPVLAGRGAVVDADVSRQGRAGVEILTALNDAGLLDNVVVIHLGTNGEISQATFDAMLEQTRGVPLVVVLTIKADRRWTEGNNALIRGLPARWPNVKVLDWQVDAGACSGDCFYDDGIHLTPEGQQYYADLIWRSIGRL
jgi:peptidoglycan/LPS O-acetylase OafA/YrhL